MVSKVFSSLKDPVIPSSALCKGLFLQAQGAPGWLQIPQGIQMAAINGWHSWRGLTDTAPAPKRDMGCFCWQIKTLWAAGLISYSHTRACRALIIFYFCNFYHYIFSLIAYSRERSESQQGFISWWASPGHSFPRRLDFKPSELARFLCHCIIGRLKKQKSIWTISRWFAFA